MKRSILSSLTALAVVITTSDALAVTHTWTGNAPSLMSNPANWIGGVPVSASSNLTLIFPNGPNSISPNQDIANPLVVQDIQFAAGQAYVLSGNDYRFNNLGAAPSMTIGNFAGINFSAGVEFNAASTVSLGQQANLNFFAPVDFNAATVFNISDQANMNFSDLTGGNLTITSTASIFNANVSFGGANPNTLSGTTTLSGYGNFILNKPANVAALAGNVVVSSASQFLQATLQTFSLNQFAAGTNLSLTNFGILQALQNQTINDLELSTGGNAFINPGQTLTIEGTITNNGGFGSLGAFNSTVDFDGQFKTVNTTTNGPNDQIQVAADIINGRINKIGPGKLRLLGQNSVFSGTNEVNGGTLSGNSATIGNVLNNVTVELTGFGDVLTTNQITGPGQVVITGSTTYQAAQGYTGGTVLQSGTLTGTTATLLGNFSSVGFGVLEFIQNANGAFAGTFSGPGQLTKGGTGVLSIGGINTYSGSTFLSGGGLNLQSDTALGSGVLFVNSSGVTLEATGTRTIANPLQMGASHAYVGSGNLTFTDTTQKVIGAITMTHNSTGNTTIDGKFTAGIGSSIVVNSGQLTLGDPAQVGGFTSAGQITVNGGTLTVRSLNFTTLPDVTLASGTLDAPNGYAIPLGAALQGTGNVTGRLATANGSTIIATGAMGLGDPSHPAGVNLDGELYTNQFLVSLSDSNQAVLGSLTDLGTATQNGTLTAGNGFVLNFGRNIVGRGQIVSNNLLNAAAIINGSVNGDSAINYLEFTGYVKGVGTFNNVAFSGTFSPGLSPTLMTIGNVIYTPSNVLTMELGGLSRGGQYDAFDVTGTMVLGGTLDIDLINAFSPALGNQFLLFQPVGGSVVGAFGSFSFPALNAGLAWDTSLLYSNGILRVVAAVPEPTALLPLGLTLAAFVGRRRRVIGSTRG